MKRSLALILAFLTALSFVPAVFAAGNGDPVIMKDYDAYLFYKNEDLHKVAGYDKDVVTIFVNKDYLDEHGDIVASDFPAVSSRIKRVEHYLEMADVGTTNCYHIYFEDLKYDRNFQVPSFTEEEIDQYISDMKYIVSFDFVESFSQGHQVLTYPVIKENWKDTDSYVFYDNADLHKEDGYDIDYVSISFSREKFGKFQKLVPEMFPEIADKILKIEVNGAFRYKFTFYEESDKLALPVRTIEQVEEYIAILDYFDSLPYVTNIMRHRVYYYYYDYEIKAPLKELTDQRHSADCIIVTMFSAYSDREFGDDYFDGLIPSDIEIDHIVCRKYNTDRLRAFLFVYIKNGDDDKLVRLAEAIWSSPEVLGADYDYYFEAEPDDEPIYAPVNRKKGDFNGDGVINMKDVAALKKYFSGAYGPGVMPLAADLDGDGRTSIKDLTLLKKVISGSYALADENVAPQSGGNADPVPIPRESYSATFTSGASVRFRSCLISYFGADPGERQIEPVGGVINSYSEYLSFRSHVDGVPIPALDESFFEKNVLVAGYVFAPYCNYVYAVGAVSFDGETIYVDVAETTGANGGFCAIEEYSLFIAIDRDLVPDASSVVFSAPY